MKKASSFLILILLAGTFFGFVDDRFRGWSDTHQYQIEAKVWKRGSRPPAQDLLLDTENPEFVGPTHVPPLVPYAWSYLVDLESPSKTVFHISLLDALLLFFCFIIYVLLLGRGQITFDAVTIAIILFFHSLVRLWVYMPMSEPLSIFLMLASYYFPRMSGVGAALQAMTRPPVALLHGLQLLRKYKKPAVVFGFLVASGWGLIFFKSLVKPSSFHGLGYGWYKSLDTFQGFVEQSAWIFKRILPYEKPWFLFIWAGVLLGILVTAVVRRRKNWHVWPFAAAYIATILVATGEGFRYFFPLILFLSVELKPKWPRSLWVRIPVFILAAHVTFQQVEAIKDLRKDRFPESDSRGLMATRNWIQGNYSSNDIIMMFRYRLCINYFDHPCVSIPPPNSDFIQQLAAKRVRLVVINRLYWQIEELDFEKKLEADFKIIHYPFEKSTKVFDNVKVIDLATLSEFLQTHPPKSQNLK